MDSILNTFETALNRVGASRISLGTAMIALIAGARQTRRLPHVWMAWLSELHDSRQLHGRGGALFARIRISFFGQFPIVFYHVLIH